MATQENSDAGREPGIFEIIYSARAMRRLKPDPVPEETLLRLIDAAIQAPTPSNSQSWRWVIVRDRQQKERLAELNRTAIAAYANRPGLMQPATPAEAARAARSRATLMWQSDHLADCPALIIACTAVDPAASPEARRSSAVSIWPAVQNLLLAARALGLGATPTTLGLADRSAAREILALPDAIEAHVLIPVGYPMGRFGPVTRPPARSLTRFDRWS